MRLYQRCDGYCIINIRTMGLVHILFIFSWFLLQQLSNCGGKMKPGDQVHVSNYKNDSLQIMTVLEITDKSVKLKHATISGFFVFSKEMVEPIKK